MFSFYHRKISWVIVNEKHVKRYCWLFADQPEIALNPLNATKVEGENITWSCNATGNPEPIISWIFYGSNINTTYNPRIVFSKGRQEMTITSIIRTDNGEYQCMASNMLGNVSSRVATLDILCRYDWLWGKTIFQILRMHGNVWRWDCTGDCKSVIAKKNHLDR